MPEFWIHACMVFCAVSISNDFMIEPATISEEENCTTISIGDDDVIERNKAFDVTLRPHLHRDENTENQSSTEISFTVILEDNDSEQRPMCLSIFINFSSMQARRALNVQEVLYIQ